jgi:excisionase family DNA binding protein
VGEDRTEGAQQDESPKEYVTVGEAAKLLGIHRNTVHNRIKVGRIIAHKVVEGEREVYRIERDSLGVGRTSAHVHTLDAQRTTASEELSRMIATRLDEIVRDYTHELYAQVGRPSRRARGRASPPRNGGEYAARGDG